MTRRSAIPVMTRRSAIRGTVLALVATVIATTAISAVATGATTPRASLTDIENDVMCVACRESLAVAQSPQAESERSYIRGLIAQGETKKQIEQNLVAQYGPAVLGRPPARGFNLTVYILPPAILTAGIAILAVTLPRWRRRTRAAARSSDQTLPALDPAEAQRLEQELSQFRG
jgi:cytochrome c-type biogenesis protein CcmH